MPPALSDIERKILDFMVQYLRTNTYQPSIREIGEEFGIKSTKTVSEHLQALAEKGFLERDPSRSRGVRILGVDLDPQTVSVPCYDALPEEDGPRTERAEMFLNLDRRLAGPKGAFFVRARGTELAPLGISGGDFVLVEPVAADGLEPGVVVAVRLENGPCYCHVHRNGSGSLHLRPVGEPGAEMLVEDPSRLSLVGRISALYRRMDGATAPVSTALH